MSESHPVAANPNTRARTRVAAVTMAGLGAVSLFTGCTESSGSESRSKNSDCAAIDPGTWTPIPKEINVPQVADRLGQEPAKVTLGKIGTVNCEGGIDFDMVIKGAPVRVSGTPSGISDRCLTVMSEAPASGVVHRVGVLCPAQ